MNLSTEQKHTHKYRKQTCGCQVRQGRQGRGMDWEFGISRCKLLYIGWINKVLLYSTGNCIQYPVINHNGKEYEKYVYMYVCICESLCRTVEINTTL